MSESFATAFSVEELLEVVTESKECSARLAASKGLCEAIGSGVIDDAIASKLREAYAIETDVSVATQLLKAINRVKMLQKQVQVSSLTHQAIILQDSEDIKAALVALKGLYDRPDSKRVEFEERYEVLGLVGEGGMGKAFKARDRNTDHIVAIKYLADCFLKNENVTKRFKREFDVLESLSHPGLAKVYEYGAGDGELFIVMDYVEGPNLEQVVDRGGVATNDFVDVLKKLCLCFEHLHEQGLVHRDVKPGNILLESVDGNLSPKLVDFGLVKVSTEDGLTKTATRMGTIEFLAPEQLANARDVGPQCDIYSLGVTAYYALSQGRLPAGDYPLLHELDPDFGRLGHIIEKCLHKRPEGRWESMAALRAALEDITFEEGTVYID